MRLFAVTPGFEPSHLLTAQVVGTFQTNDTTRRQFFEDALSAVRQLPGVSDAAFTSQLPLSGEVDGYGYDLQSQPSIQPGGLGSALRYVVTPHYFDAMRIPLISGRVLDASDRPGAPESVVISQSLARRLFGNANPIGQRMRFGPEAGSEHPWDIVVGVVGDVKQESLATSQVDAFYVALGQWSWVDNVQSIVVRTTGDAAALAPSVKQAIWSVGKDHPIQRVSSMDALISASGAQRRFALVVIEAFALAALVLAAIGLYGVIAGGVTERTREIGIRMALGATSSGVALSVVSRGVLTATFGVAIGLIGAVAASRLLASLLFSVSRLDVTTYASVSALLVGIAALASWVPARRAANVDPSMTMRSD
jgi:putative ABC transport system permease protein